jgi:tRNA modification GTPase
MDSLVHHGARPALPGEFTFRAVKHQKMTLDKAEALSDLIQAQSEPGLELALDNLAGLQRRQFDPLVEKLRILLADCEAHIDFVEHDLPDVSSEILLERWKTSMAGVQWALAQILQSHRKGRLLQEGVNVCIAGLPNAGKSSLFNAWVGEDRSIVSEYPGTTRDMVCEVLVFEGEKGRVTFRIEDTSGLRKTTRKIEKIGIEKSMKAAKKADILLLVVACGSGREELEQLESFLERLGLPQDHVQERTVGVFSKGDLGGDIPLRECLNAFHWLSKVKTWVTTSAKNAWGIQEAIEILVDRGSSFLQRAPGEYVLTRLEQKQSLVECLNHLERAKDASGIELFAADLRQALGALAPLVGDTMSEDVLSKIFSTFCIGK